MHVGFFSKRGFHGTLGTPLDPPLAFDFKHSVEIEPDILLGPDQYWSLWNGELIKSTSGPVAHNTHLQWIPSGPVSVKGSIVQHALVTRVADRWR